MGTSVPPSLVAAFTFGGTAGVDYTIIPVPSQVSVSPELASFTTGFPEATRTARTSGGIPPRGLDMNGILYMVSGHTAWQAAGMSYTFNADVVTINGGYNVGAILRSAVDSTKYFYNTAVNNTTDPDSAGVGWVEFSPLANPTGVYAAAIPAGSQIIALPLGAGFADLELTAGDATITNFTGGSNGQVITVTNVASSTDVLTVQSNANIRLSGDLSLLAGGSISLRYSSVLATWVAMS